MLHQTLSCSSYFSLTFLLEIVSTMERRIPLWSILAINRSKVLRLSLFTSCSFLKFTECPPERAKIEISWQIDKMLRSLDHHRKGINPPTLVDFVAPFIVIISLLNQVCKEPKISAIVLTYSC